MSLSKFLQSNRILVAILVISAFFHFFRLDYPNAYVFDEVYHGFTAKEYLKGSMEAWEWWTTPPPGVAFEWTHPPLAKEIMTVSMYILSFFTTQNTDAIGWRLPGAILGVISVFLVYKLGQRLFGKTTGLIAAFLFSFDGLNFVQSRTGMNDIYLVTFALASILFLLNKKFLVSAIFLGLAFASKWSAFYLLGLNGLLVSYFFLAGKLKFKEAFRVAVLFAVIAPVIYLLSYLPFFLFDHNYGDYQTNWDLFVELQRQMWWYHSNLLATHDYSSPAWSWPLNLYPVWYFVEYHDNGLVSNIFASGNPVLFWMGVGGMIITVYDFILSFRRGKKNQESITHSVNQPIVFNNRDRFFIVLLGYLAFWLPWIFSPRIMFLYHYSPSIPFLCLSLGYQLDLMVRDKKSKVVGLIILGLIVVGFMLVYPMLTGIPLSRELFSKFFDFNLTKNPFGQ